MLNSQHFDLQSLRIFLAVAETGSLTKAAERSYMTLSAVSKRIAELERNIDCALFLRLPRGMELTSAGIGLLNHARKVLDQVNRMVSDMDDYVSGIRGNVRLWCNTSSIIQFLPRDLPVFLQSNPGIQISIEEKLSTMIIEALSDGRADIGIFADNIPAPGISKQLYHSDKLILLVPQHHPLADHRNIAFAETLDFDYVGLNKGSSLLIRLLDAATALERLLKIRIQVSSFDGICRMIESGLGIGILPAESVRPEILGQKLKAIPLTDPWADRNLWVGIKKGTELQPEAQRLFEFLGNAHYQANP